jgi:hypothetical protein
MIKFLIILFLPLLLNASKILSYNVYDRTDRVDVMITFDTPYEGVIKQKKSNSKIIIKLEDSSIESPRTKELSSKFLNSLDIVPMAGNTQIVAVVPPSIVLKASKTSDAYGLRLRFTKASNINKTAAGTKLNRYTNSTTSKLPTKKSDDLTSNYIIVSIGLFLGIILLFVLKNKINSTPNKKTKKQKSWLFKESKDLNSPEDGVSIRFQKTIDENSSVVMLDFVDQSYLVLMGTNNILLDKFTDNKPVTQSDFETILQNRHKELDNFLKKPQDGKDPVQLYKEKAAVMSYAE